MYNYCKGTITEDHRMLMSNTDLDAFSIKKGEHPRLTIGKKYKIIKEVGNGYVVKADDGKDEMIVLQERFSERTDI